MNDLGPLANGLGALQNARAGIQKAVKGLSRDAVQIAQSATQENGADNVVSALVDARQQRLNAQASARVMKTADEMIGTLLDVRA
jgi:hypothetical protein